MLQYQKAPAELLQTRAEEDSIMRSYTILAISFVLVVILAGCPFVLPQNRTFTSADVGQGSFFGGLGGADAAEGETEGESPTAGGDGTRREVVEPDVIRRQGNLLYVLNQYRGLSIVDLDTETLLVQVPTLGYPRDLYFAQDQAYVLVGYVPERVTVDDVTGVSYRSRLYAVDVTNPSEAAIRSSIDLVGDLVDSRLVGDVLYAVTAEYNYGYYEEFAVAGNATATTVTSVDVADPDDFRVADQLVFEGSGSVVHVTSEFAFVASPSYQNDTTEITCLDISDPGGTIQNVGVVQVRGYVDDRFKMDAWQGALRVVSTSWQGENQVYLTTFDLGQASLPQLAELRLDGAEGETLFATRFDGPRAYVVTFLIVDPLFVLDVSDPANPKQLGALEVPGYSTHIEPFGDRLIALGVDTTNGQRVSLSIFDVAGDGPPSLVDRVSFGGEWSWSSAHSDVKALTILDDVIIVPFSGWSGTTGGFERLQFVSYTPDSLQLRGTVDLSGSILRSFDYNARYYGVTTEQVTRINGDNLDSPVAEHSITIAENVVDFLELRANLSAEVVVRNDEGQILVRTLDGDQNPLGELLLDVGYFFGAYPSGDDLVIAGTDGSGEGGYAVSIVDVRDPQALAVRKTISVDVYPYYDYYYYYDYGFGGGVPEVAPGFEGDVRKDIAIGYPYYYGNGGEKGFLLGDTLALRCFADRFDTTFGDAVAYQGLAIVDLTAGEWVSTVGLGYETLVSLNAVDNKIYAGSKESLGAVPFQRAMASYYLQELDVLRAVEGPLVNVPGTFVQYDAISDVLTLSDHQWATNGSVTSSLKTVRWAGGQTVTPLDSANTGSYIGQVIATGNRLYFETYTSGYQLNRAVIGSDGTLELDPPVAISDAYGRLIGAHGDDVFIGLAYSAIGHYTFNGGTAEMMALVAVSGYPSTVRFGDNQAWFPLGYYGVVGLPL